MGRPKQLISQLDLHVEIIDYFMARGQINGHEFVYNWGCEVRPRFINYKATDAEVVMLHKMLNVYLSSDEAMNEIAIAFEDNCK